MGGGGGGGRRGGGEKGLSSRATRAPGQPPLWRDATDNGGSREGELRADVIIIIMIIFL